MILAKHRAPNIELTCFCSSCIKSNLVHEGKRFWFSFVARGDKRSVEAGGPEMVYDFNEKLARVNLRVNTPDIFI
jgi:hypothetical protein